MGLRSISWWPKPIAVTVVVVTALTAVLVPTTTSSSAAPETRAQPAVQAQVPGTVPPPALLTSNWELATGNSINRGCGVSAPLPADPDESLWLFCDIELFDSNGGPYSMFPFRPGTFAAVGPTAPGEVPAGLSELPTPPTPPDPQPSDRAPELFLPIASDLTLPDGTPCGAASNTFATVRPRGVVQGPTGPLPLDGSVQLDDASDYLFIVYADICMEDQLTEHVKRVGIAVYDPDANEIVSRTVVFDSGGDDNLPWYQDLAHPVIADHDTNRGGPRLYLVASICDDFVVAFAACVSGRVFLAHVRMHHDSGGPSPIYDAASYRYWNPSLAGIDPGPDWETSIQTGWVAAQDAESILPEDAAPLHTALADVRWNQPALEGQATGLVLVEQWSYGGHYRIWQANTPTEPWVLKDSDASPCRDTACRDMFAHPEMSTPDELLISQQSWPERQIEVVARPTAQIESAPPGAWVTSNYERATMRQVHRECGWSAPLPDNPDESLWIFCDMLERNSASEPVHPWLGCYGTCAAIGPHTTGQVPTALNEGTSGDRPHDNMWTHLLDNPEAAVCPAGNGRLTYAHGVTQGPSGQITIQTAGGPTPIQDGSQLLFIPYTEMCYDGEQEELSDILVFKRAGIAIYEPGNDTLHAQTITHEPPSGHDRLAWHQILVHPIFDDDYMYLFAGTCDIEIDPYGPNQEDKCPGGTVGVARVPHDDIHDPGEYQWRSGPNPNDWSSDMTDATTILPPASAGRGPVAVATLTSVGDFTQLGKGYLLIETTSWVGHYRIWQAESVPGPWTLVRDEGDVMPGCGETLTLSACYNFGSHPQLSTPSDLMISRVQPSMSLDGHNTSIYEVQIVSIGTVPDV